jgi:hypothetical protein
MNSVSDFIDEMQVDILQSNVIKRNIAIDTLQIALKELKRGRKELNHMVVDPCHVETDSLVHDDYGCIIREIGSLIKIMVGGDWCFSVNNTAEAEKAIKDEVEKSTEKIGDMI